MPPLIQIQIFGKNNQQNNVQVVQASFASLLNQAEGRLRNRGFVSDEVKSKYQELLPELNKWLHDKREETFEATAYILFPFETNPKPETFQDHAFLESIMDTLTLIAMSGSPCKMEKHYLNTTINEQQICGIYYQVGLYELTDAFQILLKSFHSRGCPLPSGFIFIILNSHGENLDPEKIKNIVPDILGDTQYIKPLQVGNPKCISLRSDTIRNCQTIDEASAVVRELLSVA